MDTRTLRYEELKIYLDNPDSLNQFRTSVIRLETEALENGDFSTLRLVSLLKDVMISRLLNEQTL
jgi:hypothetical protein